MHIRPIQRLGKSYANGIEEITDLCECRIITYYLDDVEILAKAIRKEFIVEEEELRHQQDSFDADRFWLSLISFHHKVKG